MYVETKISEFVQVFRSCGPTLKYNKVLFTIICSEGRVNMHNQTVMLK